MSEEEAKRFRMKCIRYACRKGHAQDADDFAQESYFLVTRWPRFQMRHCWHAYWRIKLGVKGFARNRTMIAIYHRLTEMEFDNGDKLNVLEEMVPGPERKERISLPYLDLEEACLRILSEEGFNREQVSVQMNRSQHYLRRLNRSIQKKIIENEPDLLERFEIVNHE